MTSVKHKHVNAGPDNHGYRPVFLILTKMLDKLIFSCQACKFERLHTQCAFKLTK